jgi:hypothetical protein
MAGRPITGIILNYVDNAGESIDVSSAFVTLSATNQASFSMPFDGVVKDIYASIALVSPTVLLNTHHPLIQLYGADPRSNDFVPIPGASAIVEPGITGVTEANSVYAARKTNINVELAAGTRILIVAMLQVEGGTAMRTDYWNFSGTVTFLFRYAASAASSEGSFEKPSIA